MRIACPSCSATYDVPDSLMTPGRVTRCARCGNEWTPVAIVAVPEEPEPPLPEEPTPVMPAVPEPPSTGLSASPRRSAMDRLAARVEPPRPSIRLRLAWGGSILLLILLIGAAFLWRSQFVAAWPPSARAYAVFGLHSEKGSPP